MKHLKKWGQLSENLEFKTLYHASPYKFEKFRNSDTFFSEVPKFAIEYAEEKSFDAAMDEEANLYTVKLLDCQIFDINKEEDYAKMHKVLPDKVSYHYNNFGFSASVKKDEIMYNMKGVDMEIPNEEAVNANIGDIIPDPEYNRDSLLVLKKDDKYAYCADYKNYRQNIEEVLSKTYNLFGRTPDKWRKDIFQPVVDYIIGYMKTNDIKDDFDKYKTFNSFFKGDLKPTIKKLYTECEEEYRKVLLEKGYCSKVPISSFEIELHDTWRFYENTTVLGAIKQLGYDGYVAKEKKHFTYNIFHPNRCVEMVSYQFPVGYEFSSMDEYRKYQKIYHELYLQDKKIDRVDAYKAYKASYASSK